MLIGQTMRGRSPRRAFAFPGGARSCGIAQVVLGCRLFAQFSESSVTEFLFHALPEFVWLAKETPGPLLLGSFALVVHVTVRSRAK